MLKSYRPLGLLMAMLAGIAFLIAHDVSATAPQASAAMNGCAASQLAIAAV